MLNKLTTFARTYQMFSEGEHIICAVSGGADSMALLWSLYLLKEQLGIRLSAAHFNHQLRGAESDADEAFVRAFCSGYGIELFVGRGQVTAGQKGLEAAAREARYRFFDTLPGKIATAHTADDNAETVLLHLVRGTGLQGLGGITPVRGNLIRPMLTVTRQDVLALLEAYSIPSRSDSSNATDQFLRNRLRHHVMPLLQEENPRLAENMSAMALSLREDAQLLSQIAENASQPDVDALRCMPKALRSRILQAFLKENGVREPERSHIALAESLVFSQKPSAQAQFPGNITLQRQYNTLCVLQSQQPPEPVRIQCPGVTELPQWGLRLYCTPAKTAEIGPDTLTFVPVGAVVVRSRQPGDQIRLSGGTKTLKKLLIDRKIPASQRPFVPVLADDIGVLCVPGIGTNLDRVGAGFSFRFESIPWDEKRFE